MKTNTVRPLVVKTHARAGATQGQLVAGATQGQLVAGATQGQLNALGGLTSLRRGL